MARHGQVLCMTLVLAITALLLSQVQCRPRGAEVVATAVTQSPRPGGGGIPGGWENIISPNKDVNAVAAAKMVVTKLNHKTDECKVLRGKYSGTISFASIEEGSKQVVAGFNYKLSLELVDKKKHAFHLNVTVWDRRCCIKTGTLESKYKITSCARV